jgi:hypothetical protein
MPAKKMRIDLFDNQGNRYTIAFEGQVTREKALHLLDLIELLGGMPGDTVSSGRDIVSESRLFSKYEKVRVILQKSFPIVWFSSREVQSAYEQEFKEFISISTVATYLGRMANKGMLLKAGTSNSLKYKLASNVTQAIIQKQVT